MGALPGLRDPMSDVRLSLVQDFGLKRRLRGENETLFL